MKANLIQIYWLLHDSDISKYSISKATGIHITTLTNIETGSSLIENLSFKNAAALTEYAEKIMKDGGIMNIWKRNGYTVEEREFDYSLHKFVIVVDDEDMSEIVPDSFEIMNDVIVQLNEGKEAIGMADGQGGEVTLPYYMIETEDHKFKKQDKNALHEVFNSYSRKEALSKYQALSPNEGESLIVSKVNPDNLIEWIAEKDYRD